MKILVIADEESKSLYDFYTPDKLEGVDLIISCGDLDARYLEFLVTMKTVPLLYIPGNHDSHYVQKPPEGCIPIDGKIYDFNGVRILGFGGSMKYKPGPYMYTEKEMAKRIRSATPGIVLHKGFDILVTHAPAKGYGDMDDLPHNGFQCFESLIDFYQPSYMLHGHVHQSYTASFKRETKHPGGTTIINAFTKYMLEFDENNFRIPGTKENLSDFFEIFNAKRSN
ncbi:MAG: metallophosphoesterase family protein [Lachnospiraceae bacterium]|nr:metallophosphoesterase family protein [Lachnospiraceae bacterium]